MSRQMLEESFNQRGICSLDQSLDKRQKTKDSPFTEHIEEYIDVDGEEDEKVKTFSTVLHCHS